MSGANVSQPITIFNGRGADSAAGPRDGSIGSSEEVTDMLPYDVAAKEEPWSGAGHSTRAP